MSDMHLEFSPFGLESDGNVLILAGDILVADYMTRGADSPYTRKVVPTYNKFMEQARANYDHVLMVMGNHEHYHGDISKSAGIIRTAYPWLTLLDNQYVDIEGTRFFGGTMWTDFDKGNPLAMMFAADGMNDFRLIKNKHKRFRPADALEHWKFFVKELSKAYVPDMVVVSHHAPSFSSVNLRYAGSPLNAAYASDMTDFLLEHKLTWVHGHMHHTNKYHIGNSLVVSNPRGYHGENEEFNQWLQL